MLLCLPTTAWPSTSFSGYSKLFLESYAIDKEDLSNNPHRISRANRLSVVKPWNTLSFEGSYPFIPYYQYPPSPQGQQERAALGESRGYRAYDINEIPWQRKNNYLHHNIDRAFFTYAPEGYTLTIGRQPLAFGSSPFINPTDVFAPFSPLAIDREERLGIDGMRLRWFIGESEADFGILFGHRGEEKHNAAYLKYNINLFETDISGYGIHFRERQLLGLDISGNIMALDLVVETAYIFGKEDSFSRTSVATQYLFPEDYQLALEFHTNTRGGESADDYPQLLAHSDFRAAEIMYLGRRYLSVSVAKPFSPILAVSLASIQNLSDRGRLISGRLEWNTREDQYFDLGGFLSEGVRGSEFQNNPDLFFTSYRHYF